MRVFNIFIVYAESTKGAYKMTIRWLTYQDIRYVLQMDNMCLGFPMTFKYAKQFSQSIKDNSILFIASLCPMPSLIRMHISQSKSERDTIILLIR